MKYPSFLYHCIKSSESTYSFMPPGLLDVGKMANDQPCWKKFSPQEQIKQKFLILADWSAGTWSRQKIAAVKNQIQDLLVDGFSVALWLDERLEKLTPDSLKLLDESQIRQEIKPFYTEEIKKIAIEQFKLQSIDEIQVLDDYGLHCLLEKKELAVARSVDVMDLTMLANSDLKKVFAILKKEKPILNEVIHSEFSANANALVNKLLLHFPEIKTRVDYQKLSIPEKNLQSLLEFETPYHLHGYDINHDQLDFISNLTIEQDFNTYSISSPEDLGKLLKKFKQIKTLKLGCASLDEPGLLTFDLHFLQSLHLEESSISPDNLEQLLTKTPMIEELRLDGNLNLGGIIKKPFNLPPSIKILDLSGVNLAPQALTILLEKTQVLEELNLSENRLLRELKEDRFNLPSFLKTLRLQNCQLSWSDLQKILANTKLLRNLYLNHCGNLIDFNEGQVNLPYLERLDFICGKISSADFYKLTSGSLLLKVVNLKLCENLKEFEKPCFLPALLELYLTGSTKTAMILKGIAGFSPLLKKLDLFGRQNWDGVAEVFHFQYLQDVTLREANISALTLQKILTRSANSIKKIDLSSCENLGENGDEFHYPKLETLILSDSSITSGLLKKILAFCSIKHLNLSNCKQLKEFNPEEYNFRSLETINFSASSCSSTAIQNFLAKLPFTLKELHLHQLNCELSTRKFDLSSLNNLILNDSNINFASLKALVARARSLQKLVIDCPPLVNLSAEQLEELLKLLPLLTALTLKRGYIGSDQRLKEKFPFLTIYYMGKTNKIIPYSDQMIEAFTPSDPIHSPVDHQEFNPTNEEEFRFEFKGTNKTLNQGMIIEKLSQYFTICHLHESLIPKIQDGICNALSHYSLEKKEAWNEILKQIRAWDGNKESLSESLRCVFEELAQAIKRHQGVSTLSYLGDNLIPFLKNNPDKPLILMNPWHAIALHHQEGSWHLYDPNFKEGAKTVSWEDLPQLLQDCIGRLIFVEQEEPCEPLVNNSDEFLRDGGLLVLCYANNRNQLLSQLNTHDYSEEALEGLLLRDTQGRPAWMIGLNRRELRYYTLKLLKQFMVEDKNQSRLEKSLEVLTPFQRFECLVSLYDEVSLHQEFDALRQSLIPLLHFYKTKDYEQQLETWNTIHSPPESLDSYCQKLVKIDDQENQLLVKLHSEHALLALNIALLKHCKSISRPVFCINSPEDLVCSARYTESDGKFGLIKEGPGGPLYDFLMTHQDKSNPPILLINYSNFKPDEIIQHHALLEDTRFADGTPLWEGVKLIGLINLEKPSCYQGKDFYSRFGLNQISGSSLSNQELEQTLTPLPQIKNLDEAEEDAVIHLNDSEDWKNILLGHWIIKGKLLEYEEGELIKAINTGKPIHLQNAPWGNPHFQIFWQQTLARGYVHYPGGKIVLPKELKWSQGCGYPWEKLLSLVHFETKLAQQALILNPHKLTEFFKQYECNSAEESLNTLPGFLAQHQGKSLTVNLTRSLNEREWGLLLLECQKQKIKLNCHLAPGVLLPEAFEFLKIKAEPAQSFSWDKKINRTPLVICSTDVATTQAILTEKNSEWMIIDVSECHSTDLLGSLQGSFNKKTKQFEFQNRMGLLQKALDEGKKIILKGNFSDELVDCLAPLLLAPNQKGQLILISNQLNVFNYLNIQEHAVNPEEKMDCLIKEHNCTAEEGDYLKKAVNLEKESYSRLCARLTFIRASGRSVLDLEPNFSDKAWLGMKETPVFAELAPFDMSHSSEEAEAFIQKRLKAVNEALEQAPYVYISGASAVGKTTFVDTYLDTEESKVYKGIAQARVWALDQSEKRKILFIDEANLTQRQWSEFESLFNLNPPAIRIGNEYFPLTKNHKVVFAGNPLNYGGERQLPSLFVNHGKALLFEPMPLAFIYEKMLKPVFEGSGFDAELPELVHPILEVYRFICKCSTDEVLISPRELQMMALQTLAYAQKANSKDCILAAQHYAYQLGRNLIPKDAHAAFDEQFRPNQDLKRNPLPFSKSSFLLTPSRQVLAEQLGDLLNLKELRSTWNEEAQRYGGLGGIVIEGEPGIGKSELVRDCLHAHGYELQTDNNNRPKPEKTYYNIPVSMQLDDKKKLLLKAFDEGAVVIIDEINSSPMIEVLLNDLLMGKNPESPNGRPQKPGFLLIGTQNPVTMSGRHKPSTALQRRLISTILPSYTAEEMEAILIAKNLNSFDAKAMVAAFEKNLKRANKEMLSPAPTFRDLSKLAKRIVKAQKNKSMITKKQSTIKQSVKSLFKFSEQPKTFFSGVDKKKIVQEKTKMISVSAE